MEAGTVEFDYPFTIAEVDEAIRLWGCNCGPSALAFAAQIKLDVARTAIPDFDRKGYTSPSMMKAALANLGRRFTDVLAPGKTVVGDALAGLLMCHPQSISLVRIQFTGPWTAPGANPRWAYGHTHWVAAWRHGDVPAIFDINGGVEVFLLWRLHILPELAARSKRADGGWYATHIWRLT